MDDIRVLILLIGIGLPIILNIIKICRDFSKQENEDLELETTSKLTPKQNFDLHNSADSSQKIVHNYKYNHSENRNDSFPIIDTSYSTVKKTTYQELQNKLQSQKKIIGNCEWCGTGYFEDDRNCVSCGGSINQKFYNGNTFYANTMYDKVDIINEFYSLVDKGKTHIEDYEITKVINLCQYPLTFRIEDEHKTYSLLEFGAMLNIRYVDLKKIISKNINIINCGYFFNYG